MPLDVLDLRSFYASPLGHVSRRFLGEAMARLWPDTPNAAVLGIGYATPYLSLWRRRAERTIAFMPAAQGVVNWPPDEPSCTALVDPADLPLPDGSVDRVVLVHALEAADNPAALLSEVWRVLMPGGRLMIAAPNRRSLWARLDTTPFGDGRPFSRGQLNRLMRETMFSPDAWGEALFSPPLPWRLSVRAAPAWERIGRRLSFPPPGLHLVDATKQLYRPAPARRARRFSLSLEPVLAPAPSPRVGEAPGGAGNGRSALT